MSLRNPDDMVALADSVLEAVGHEGAEVAVIGCEEALTRFAGNRIHQNVAESSQRLRLRVISDDRVGVAEIRGEIEDAPRRLAAAAEAARRLSPPGEVTPLPRPDAGADDPVAHSPATAACTPEWRAAQVERIVSVSMAAGF